MAVHHRSLHRGDHGVLGAQRSTLLQQETHRFELTGRAGGHERAREAGRPFAQVRAAVEEGLHEGYFAERGRAREILGQAATEVGRAQRAQQTG